MGQHSLCSVHEAITCVLQAAGAAELQSGEQAASAELLGNVAALPDALFEAPPAVTARQPCGRSVPRPDAAADTDGFLPVRPNAAAGQQLPAERAASVSSADDAAAAEKAAPGEQPSQGVLGTLARSIGFVGQLPRAIRHALRHESGSAATPTSSHAATASPALSRSMRSSSFGDRSDLQRNLVMAAALHGAVMRAPAYQRQHVVAGLQHAQAVPKCAASPACVLHHAAACVKWLLTQVLEWSIGSGLVLGIAFRKT